MIRAGRGEGQGKPGVQRRNAHLDHERKGARV